MKKAIIIFITLCCLPVSGVATAEDRIYGPVQRDENLFRIAQKYRSPGVTMAQLMMAIFEKNPEAFHKGNINRLKVGAVLKIPAADEAAALAPRQAYRKAVGQIDIYETEVRDLKVERGELAPLGQAPRDPDLATGIVVAPGISEPDAGQLEEIKQELAEEQHQVLKANEAGGALPEPKPPKRAKKQRQSEPLFRYSYDLSVISDDNIRLARDEVDIRDDAILSATLKAKGGQSLDSFTIWNYGGSVTYNKFNTFEELDNVEFEINTHYRFALSSGFTSPIYSLGAKLVGLDYESEMRDSTVISLSAELNKWLTNTINLTAGLGFKQRESVSEVFDLDESRIFGNLDFNLSKTDLVYTTLAFISGDVASSATPSVGIINVSDAIEPDDAFGGLDTNQFAYRIEAETLVLTLGYNKILTRDLSFDLSARIVDSEASDDPDVYYDRTIIRASLLGRF